MNSAQSNNLSSSQLGQHTQHQATLVIFCKRPKLHQGKQRLVKDSNAKSALNVAQALLACAIEDANNWQGPVVIAYTDHADKQWAQSLTNKAQVIAQLPEGNLQHNCVWNSARLYFTKTLRQNQKKRVSTYQ